MSLKHLPPAVIERSVHVIDSSGVVDLICPPRKPGQRGRIGRVRENVRLFLIGMHLCARLGHETTLMGIYQTLTQALSREDQWRLGVRRTPTTASKRPRRLKPVNAKQAGSKRRRPSGKINKKITELGVEEISYDDLHRASLHIRGRLDYGHGSAPSLTDAERLERREIVDQIVDALIAVTTIARAGTAWAIDATGQWAWSRGPRAPRAELQAHLDAGKDDDELLKDLEVAGIHIEDDGMSAPAVQQPAPAGLRGRCLDAAWGYKTGKNGKKETGYGFHQHTMVRVADPNAASDSEPKLVDALVITPANSHFVEPSLRMIDRLRRRHTITLLIGDGLYNNPTADTWAVPLAQRGIDQSLAMRQGDWGVVDIEGAQMQHGWMHCPRAPMHRRPRPPSTPDEPLTDETIEAIEEFKYNWAFDRKVSGLGASLTSKWICPALAGRVGCHARPDTIPDAMAEGRPIVVPPEDWTSRKCCTGNTLIFTPDPTNKHHQRRIAQRHYVGTRKWRKARKRRPQIEGVFGVLKNPSRQRMRRGHNRLPGLALASIIAGIKVALYNEEELRTWHHATGLGPSDHPLLQDDPEYHGFRHLEAVEAEAIDLHHLRGDGEDPALTLVAA